MPRKKKDGFAGRTHIGLVWDESGSMAHLTTQGNEFIDDQLGAARGHDTTFTLVKFGTQFENGCEVTWDAVDPHRVTSADAHYVPSGGTPMYDGIGQAIRTMERKVGKSDRALIVIFTDGYENSSKEWDEDKVKRLIKDKEDEGNWSFAFTAAGLDEWAARQVAASINVSGRSVQSTPATPGGMHVNSGTTVGSTSAYLASNQASSRSFYGQAEDQQPKTGGDEHPLEDETKAKAKRKPRVKS